MFDFREFSKWSQHLQYNRFGSWCLNTVKCVSMTCKRALNLYFTSSIFHTADWWHISANSILFICLLSSRRKFAHQISIDEWLTSTAVAVRWLPFIYTLKTGCQYKKEGLKTYLMHAQVRRNRFNESVDESEVISRSKTWSCLKYKGHECWGTGGQGWKMSHGREQK